MGKPAKFPITVDIAVFDEDKMLTIIRGKAPCKGYHALPGGFIDKGEVAEHAAIRELKEETSLTAINVRFLGLYDALDRDPRGQTFGLLFLATLWEGEAKAKDDADEIEWLPSGPAGYRPLAFDHNLMISEIGNLWENSIRKDRPKSSLILPPHYDKTLN